MIRQKKNKTKTKQKKRRTLSKSFLNSRACFSPIFMPDIPRRRGSPTLRASCRARLPTHRSIKKDTPRGKKGGKRGGIRFPEFHSILSFPSVCSSRRPILLRNARLGNVAHAETRRVLRMLSNDGGVGEDDGKRREKFERKKLEEKLEHFSLERSRWGISCLGGEGGSLTREIF